MSFFAVGAWPLWTTKIDGFASSPSGNSDSCILARCDDPEYPGGPVVQSRYSLWPTGMVKKRKI